MCGFIGNVSFNTIDNNKILNCNKYLQCRGPDELKIEQGNFDSLFNNQDSNNFNFIFNRLSIVDLTSKGSQPMISKEFNTVLMFNGEIYNHKVLRKNMEKDSIKFYSNHSDSEVVLNGVSKYGPSYINNFSGQFAFAIYDSRTQKLLLARDRLGQKPLFYFIEDGTVAFSSNLKSLYRLILKKIIDERNLTDYLELGVIPSPNTIFKNIYKVPPACYLEITLNNNLIKVKNYKKYWSIDQHVGNENFDNSEFMNIFSNAIIERQNADVSVANFLSGGIDSTSILKNMYDRGSQINTFSVGIDNSKYDESYWFNQVAEKYNTNHLTKTVSVENIKNELEISIDAFDEPYADPSTVLSFVISKEISKDYKVAISGDGGDELLSGYFRINYLMKRKNVFNEMFSGLIKIYPGVLGTGNKILRNSLNQQTAHISFFSDKKLLDLLNLKSNFTLEELFTYNHESKHKNILINEYIFYLSEMMLLKVDRTSMANSLEVRSPFVDHKLVEYIFSTNDSLYEKTNNKLNLKSYILEDFDNKFVDRKKSGFVFNLEDWIFNNQSYILNYLLSNNHSKLSYEKISNLFKVKTRINGLRIWRLYFLERYLDSVLRDK